MKTECAPASFRKPARKILWMVQEGGPNCTPMAFVLAGYGDAWVANGLARAMGPDQTVFGLQPPGDLRGVTANDLAAIYAEQLKSAQPQGPYCLCGYSAGALMALEVAILLRAQGEEVGLVGILDPLFIRYRRFEHLVYLTFQLICGVLSRVLPLKPRVMHILKAMFQDEGLNRHLEVLAGHKSDRYSGEIVFYKTRWPCGRSPMLLTQWRWYTKAPLRLERVKGDHHTFIRPPHVNDLARRLRLELEKAGAPRSR